MKSEQETFSSKFGCFCPFWHGAGKSHFCAEERSGAAPSSPNSNLIAHPTQVDGTAAGAPPRRSEIASTRGASGRGELLRTPGREEVKRPCDAQIAREGLASALKSGNTASTDAARTRTGGLGAVGGESSRDTARGRVPCGHTQRRLHGAVGATRSLLALSA